MNTMTTINAINTIATHNGLFHADDVFAVAVLRMLSPRATVIRTRNPEVFQDCDIVVDVGGGQFDHHQKGGNGVRENGVPYAAFGLVWKEFGELVVELLGTPDFAEIATIIDHKLVQGVDALDNGYNPQGDTSVFNVLTISDAIVGFNPNWCDDLEIDAAFEEAVDFAKGILYRLLKTEIANAKAKAIVFEAVVLQQNGVIIFNRFVPWGEHFFNAPENETVQFVIFRDTNSDEYRIQTVPVVPNSFTARKSLPETWAGLRGEELNAVIGINDGVFVHNGLFIGGAKSKDSVLKMAELALAEK